MHHADPCDKHAEQYNSWRGYVGCPFCRIARLEAALREIKTTVKRGPDAGSNWTNGRKLDVIRACASRALDGEDNDGE